MTTDLNLFVTPVNNFDIMISTGKSLKKVVDARAYNHKVNLHKPYLTCNNLNRARV